MMWKTLRSSPAIARRHLGDRNLYGFAYAGHGVGGDSRAVGGLVFKEGEDSDTLLDAAPRYTQFGINFLYAFGCSTATRSPNNDRLTKKLGFKYSPWEMNVAQAGFFRGVWGEVNGYQAWSHVVITHGTNRK